MPNTNEVFNGLFMHWATIKHDLAVAIWRKYTSPDLTRGLRQVTILYCNSSNIAQLSADSTHCLALMFITHYNRSNIAQLSVDSTHCMALVFITHYNRSNIAQLSADSTHCMALVFSFFKTHGRAIVNVLIVTNKNGHELVNDD